MRCIRIVPGFSAEPYEVENELSALQNAVGGYIQVVYPFDDPVGILCNEEGKLTGLTANRGLFDDNGELYDILCGTVLIVGLSESDFCDLSPEYEKKYLSYYSAPERFYKDGDKICVERLPERKRKTGEIWQLKQGEGMFQPLSWLMEKGLEVRQENYEHVYTFDTDGDLNDIFLRFNLDRPEDFKGHSLSVSDIVVIDNVAHFVDSCGFKEVAGWKGGEVHAQTVC